MTGGEPLWILSQGPNVFCPKQGAAKGDGKQAAPANYPAQCFGLCVCPMLHWYDGHRTAACRNVPGSRLFTTRFGRFALFDRIR
jgi:hypothetical protein